MKYPSYFNIPDREWKNRIEKAWQMLNPCRVCPRKCGTQRVESFKTFLPNEASTEVGAKEGKVNRFSKNLKLRKLGFCKTNEKAIISSYHPHYWEERCISGQKGSGIIFFTSCNLACVYCQNYEISQLRSGHEITNEQLSGIMLELQNIGCHNINLCSPSIYMPQILKTTYLAVKKGLQLPLVWNSNGYDSVESLKLLEGIVDIYMPDIKYSDNKIGAKYSLVTDYWDKVQLAVKEMHRQVSNLEIAKNGLAVKGLLVRHLVLPNNLAGTEKVMQFLAEQISSEAYINLMDQYYPCHKAYLYPELSQRITNEEFKSTLKLARSFGLWRFDKDGFR